MTRNSSYKPRHKAERRRVLDVVRGLLRLAPTDNNDAVKEVPAR
ncbi:hypothetical protein [Actinomyces sp. MRS3W]|nr:hypothetical protein [Actinomyces sp. MRS3W]MDU0348321.1 hypothetical protein [Actinomyces sp. MRS3W]